MRTLTLLILLMSATIAEEPRHVAELKSFPTLVNPNCSHCVDEAKRRTDELKPAEPALCWTRGYSDGGAIPVRFFLSKYRVISDSYGVFVYDPDASFVRGFAPGYNFAFDGWRNGVLAMKDTSDGTVFSALSGVGIEGPRKGERLPVVPTMASTWGEAMARNPNAVAYEMHEKYKPVELPTEKNADSVKTRPAKADPRLKPEESVLGVRIGEHLLLVPHRQRHLHRDVLHARQLQPERLRDAELHAGRDPRRDRQREVGPGNLGRAAQGSGTAHAQAASAALMGALLPDRENSVIRSHSLGVPHRVVFTNGETTAVADVPKEKGGAGCGFGPHELVEAALATCLTISVEMCAAKHGIPLESVEAEVRLDRSLRSEVQLIYSLAFHGTITEEQRSLLKLAAAQCPVQRTLTGKITCRDSTVLE